MWPQVRRELFWASSLLPLVRRDLATPWSARVYATDVGAGELQPWTNQLMRSRKLVK